MSLATQLRVIVHQVQGMDNLGSIARVMTNFGFTDLWVTDPVTRDFADAQRMAVHSAHILAGMHVRDTLAEALGEVVYVVGTTSREDAQTRLKLEPEAAVHRLWELSARGRVALLLGGERRGLSDEELAHCDDVVVIPTRPEQPSMNLAQAAAVMLYLASRVGPTPLPALELPPLAHHRVLEVLEAKMRETLGGVGYLNPQQEDLVLRELVAALKRSRLTQREAELWVNAFKHLARATAATPLDRGQ